MSLLKKLAISISLLTPISSLGNESNIEYRSKARQTRTIEYSSPSRHSELYLLGFGMLWLQRKRKY